MWTVTKILNNIYKTDIHTTTKTLNTVDKIWTGT